MNFLEYKNLLKLKKINLFDDEYRISFHNIQTLNYEILNKVQKGGGEKDEEYLIPPLVILKRNDRMNLKRISLIIQNLIKSDMLTAKTLCRSDIKLLYS